MDRIPVYSVSGFVRFHCNYPKIVEKDFIYYYIIAIKWGESTHFPW
jgi:hypothetical protein